MVKLKVFIVCITVLIAFFSLIGCIETYSLESAIARGIYSDIADDMQDIGYLDSNLAEFYRNKMSELGWEQVNGDFFEGTWPREEIRRARKERNELISVTLSIRPSKVSQWLHLFIEGEAAFRFTGNRQSEYFDPGW